MATILASVCAILAAASSLAQEAATEKNVDYEKRSWPAVSNGLLFVSGEFIPPPYVVSRNNNSIYINGRHVGTPGGWAVEKQPEEKSPAPLPPDPPLPTGITKATTQYDPAFYNYLNEKRDFLVSRYGKQKAIEMLPDIYKKLPCIKDAYYDTNTIGTIVLTWESGDMVRSNEFPPQRSQDIGTHEQAAKLFDGICKIYYSGLEFNDYFMFGNVHRRGTQDGYGQFLVPIAEALKSSKDEEAFVTAMTNKFPMVTGFSETAFRSFYKHKDKLPQWEPLLQKRCKGRQ